MNLTIDGQPHDFIPLKTFRASANLPPEFGISLFAPKDFSGLGSLDGAGASLQAVRDVVVDAIPPSQSPAERLASLPSLADLFRRELTAANAAVGLREPEIDFAIMGFSAVCEAFLFALLRAQLQRDSPPDFMTVYRDWLDASVTVSQLYGYDVLGENWRVQIVRTAYGPCGLIVDTGRGIEYVQDNAQTCPAEGFMLSLLREVAAKMML